MLNFQDCKKSGELKRSLQYFISPANLWSVKGGHRKWLEKRSGIQILGNLNEKTAAGEKKKKLFRCVNTKRDSLLCGVTQWRKLGCHFNSKKRPDSGHVM